MLGTVAASGTKELVAAVARPVVDDDHATNDPELVLVREREQHELQVARGRPVDGDDGQPRVTVEVVDLCARPVAVAQGRPRLIDSFLAVPTDGVDAIARDHAAGRYRSSSNSSVGCCAVAGERVHILMVCTANQCRSPFGEVTVLARAARARVTGHRVVGRHPGDARLPATPPTRRRRTPTRVGPRNPPEHTSRLDDVRRADLVLGLERRHVQEIVLLDPRAFVKAFTLKELARRGNDVGARAPDESVADWLARVHQGSPTVDLLGMSSDDDVTDPTGSRRGRPSDDRGGDRPTHE